MWNFRKSKDKKEHPTDENQYTFCEGDFYIQSQNVVLKDGYKRYTLYPSNISGDLEFPHIALEIMRALFAPYTVFTCIYALYDPEGSVHKYWWKAGFPYRHYQFLSAYGMTANVFFDGEKKMITHTLGINSPLMSLLIRPNTHEFKGNACILYGCLNLLTKYETLDAVETAILATPFALSVAYHEEHDHLSFIINTEEIQIGTVVYTIEKACREHEKTLCITID